MIHLVRFLVNGKIHEVKTEANRTVLDVLREDLNLMGAKRGCNSGECGACTILLDGNPVNSCLVLAVDANGHEVVTIEGLSKSRKDLHPIQEAFIELGAVQCGFCTPGMIMSVKGLLDRNPNPSEEEVKLALVGNLCRCTGYIKIIEAALSAAKKMRRAGS